MKTTILQSLFKIALLLFGMVVGIKLLFIIGMNLLNDNLFYYVVQHYSNVFTCSGTYPVRMRHSCG